MTAAIRLERDAGLARLALARPQVHNAFDDALIAELTEALRALDADPAHPGLSALLQERCPSVFSAQPVFVAAPHLRRMADVIRAVEAVAALPAWHEQALATASNIGLHAAKITTIGERVERLSGRLVVESGAPARIRIELPLGKA